MDIEKLDPSSMNICEEQKAKLKELFPEVFTEGGKIDFERLKLTLGEDVDTGKERYGMNWPGKSECFKTIQQPSIATLVPCPEESVDFDTTENLFIEGDNLEVLKLLQKSYLGKIKMIYIDPPYNTGNEFIYPDNYTESLDTYLSYTGQIDNEGRKFSTNTETEGRFHSKWINMMYPRLFLARNLLRDDGVIFISINDNEVSNLRKICDEIFGEENFLGHLVWQSKKGGGGDVKTIVSEHEYLIAYSKMNSENSIGKQFIEAQPLNLIDEIGPFRKGRELNKWGVGSARTDRPTMYFPIPGPNGEDIYPIRNDGSEGRWRLGKSSMMQIVTNGNALFEKRSDGTYIVYEKIRSSEPRQKSYRTLLTDVGTAADGTAILKVLFNKKSPFDYPKPIKLIQKLLEIAVTNDEDIVLDFFSGSGTTAHAILDLNQEDDGNRKFICVQLPERTDPKSEAFNAGYKTIADIGKERIRRVIKKINEENKGKLKFEENAIDLGFKVFKLSPSNFKVWNADVGKNADAVARLLFDHIDHISHVSKEESILYEILLKSGFELSTKVEKLNLAGKTVYGVEDGAILVCLEKNLTKELFRAIAEKKPARCVCLDKGFQNDDQLKTNAVQTMKDKGIEFRTV
jgi:adenine-specific DNA-methyltransferase